MSRKNRIAEVGFYHVINRGVAKTDIYLCDDDFLKFLAIVQDVSEEYGFELYSYALMSNHYHLLVKMTKPNLSATFQKINARYSIYFNNKYQRVGPLWQGRFKSWFVFDEHYLKTLVKYIEYNPIKAGITKNIGDYKWAMSSCNVAPRDISHSLNLMLNFELINGIKFDSELDEKEQKKINELYRSKLEIKKDEVVKKKLKKLDLYFENDKKELAIFNAIKDGYMGAEIARYLGVTKATVSKIYVNYKQKIKLFTRLRDNGLFWSYSKEMSYDECGENLLIEYVLKYADFDDIKHTLKLFGKRTVKRVWEEKLKSDKSFIKINLMLARVFFGMDVEADYFKEIKNARLEKLRLLAS